MIINHVHTILWDLDVKDAFVQFQGLEILAVNVDVILSTPSNFIKSILVKYLNDIF